MKLSKSIVMVLIVMSSTFNCAQTPSKKFEKIQKYMDDATSNGLVGLVVLIKSKKYGNWVGTSGFSSREQQKPIAKENIFSLASIGKTYNAVAVLKLVEMGKLALDDKIEKYLPQEIIKGIPNAEKVTIRQLLWHTSGFHNYNRHPKLNELYLTGNLKLGYSGDTDPRSGHIDPPKIKNRLRM